MFINVRDTMAYACTSIHPNLDLFTSSCTLQLLKISLSISVLLLESTTKKTNACQFTPLTTISLPNLTVCRQTVLHLILIQLLDRFLQLLPTWIRLFYFWKYTHCQKGHSTHKYRMLRLFSSSSRVLTPNSLDHLSFNDTNVVTGKSKAHQKMTKMVR